MDDEKTPADGEKTIPRERAGEADVRRVRDENAGTLRSAELDSRVAAWLRFPLIVMIVIIHVSLFYWFPEDGGNWFWGLFSRFFEQDRHADALAAIQLFQNVLTRVAVPLFFFISGYFYFYKTENFDGSTWRAKTRSRVKTLLVPYLVWNFISAAQFFLRWKFSPDGDAGTLTDFLGWASGFRGGDADVFVGENHPLPGMVYFATAGTTVPHEFLPRPLVGQFWYVRDLFVVGLFSFVWRPLLKNRFSAAALLLAAGAAWLAFGNDLHVNAQFMTPGIFFFCAGAAFSIHKIGFSDCALPLRVPATLVYAVLAFFDWRWNALFGVNAAFAHALTHDFGILAGMIALVGWAAAGVRAGTLSANRFLTSAVFFIFGMHAVAARIFERTLLRLLPNDSSAWILVGFAAFALFALAFSLLAFWLVERFVPVLLVPLTGGRGRGKK